MCVKLPCVLGAQSFKEDRTCTIKNYTLNCILCAVSIFPGRIIGGNSRSPFVANVLDDRFWSLEERYSYTYAVCVPVHTCVACVSVCVRAHESANSPDEHTHTLFTDTLANNQHTNTNTMPHH